MPEKIRTFEECVIRGKACNAAMNENPDDPNPSKLCSKNNWMDHGQLTADGWRRQKDWSANDANQHFHPGTVLRNIMDAHSILIDATSSRVVEWLHKNNSGSSDCPFLATQGDYNNVFNIEAGTIVALNNYSPSFMLDEAQKAGTKTDVVIPPGVLQHWSEVVYLEWKNQAASRKGPGLRRVVRASVENSTTKPIIEQIARSKRANGRSSLRLTANDGDNFFFALLGSPNGSSVAHLLAQRKSNAELGWCVVESITVWFGKGHCLVLEIVKRSKAGSKEDPETVKGGDAARKVEEGQGGTSKAEASHGIGKAAKEG